MNNLLKAFLMAGLLAISINAAAQKSAIRGAVTDTLAAPMPSATVMLLNQNDSSLVNFGVTDAKGFFEIKNVVKGNYRLKVTFVGYAPADRLISATQFEGPAVDIGKIGLRPENSQLDAVVVQGEKVPVTVKRDTIEYNATAFKTRPNANVEDLIKKMPGMEVQTDGTIKAQGEEVTRVMVDGREFFGRDPKLATRNLPADAVNKVQVYDKKSDQAVFTGIDDGQREKTINLELKEEKRKGAFGNAMAGAGTTDRFQAKASINKFAKGKQLSFLGMGNNVNEQGFSMDDYMNYSGGSQQMMGGGGGVRIQLDGNNQNGVPLNFGGRQNGILTSYAGGVNTNQDIGENTKLGGSYFYNRLDQNVSKNLDRINYLPAGNYYFNQVSRQYNLSDNHRVNMTLDHRIDSANSLKFTASGTYTTTNQNLQSISKTTTANGLLQNDGFRNTSSTGSSGNFNSTLLWRHRFAKKGRTFSALLSGTISQSNTDGTLQSVNQYYTTSVEKQDIAQTNNQKSDNQTYGIQATYTEPLGNRKYLELNYAIRANRNQVDKMVYDMVSGAPVMNMQLSNSYNSNYLYSRPGVNFRMNRQKFNFTVGANYQRTDLKGTLVLRDTTINRVFENILPVARFYYDFSSFKHLRFDYETSMQEPTIQQLQPVVDNSDPLNLSVGNPSLKPSYAHSVRLNYTQFDPGKGVGLFAFVNANYTTNAITYSQTVNAKLVRTTVPVNVKYGMQLSGNFNFVFQVHKGGRFSLGPNVSYTESINLLNFQENLAKQQNTGGTARYDYNLSDILNFGLSTNQSYSHTEYSFNTAQNQTYLNSTYSAEATVTFLKRNFNFSSSFDFYRYHSQTTGFDQTIPIWNMSLSRFVLKNKVGEVKLAVVNALDKSLSVTQSATANYLQQETTNNLGRYYMVSFTYVLNRQLNPIGGGPGRGGMRMMIRN